MRTGKGFQAASRCAVIMALMVMVMGAFLQVGTPQSAAAQQAAGTQVNVELVLDSSGSMAEKTSTG